MSKKETWSNWIKWPINRNPIAVPPMVRPGDIVQADLVIRPQKIGTTTHADVVRGYVWDVKDGESFMISPPEPVITTHMVLDRFRIWLGDGGYDAAVLHEITDFDRLDLDAPGLMYEEIELLELLAQEE